MHKMFTRIALCAITALAAGNASAYDFEAGNMYYNKISETTVEVTFATADYNSYAGNVKVPATVSHDGVSYTVTSIGYRAFYASDKVTNVRIPASVEIINEEAFVGCELLTTAYMEEPATLFETSFDYSNVTLYVPELMKAGFLEELYYNQFKDIVETDEFDEPIGSTGFVISEIFFTGTTTPDGKQYSDDQYVKIGNNSDETLYLDGYVFGETAFMSTDKQDYTPDLMSEAVTLQAIYAFPGSGTDYPVAPGEEVLVAVNGINHTELNKNSFDLSTADFEFYDESENPDFQDSDTPNVPNMDNWYDYSYSYWSMHNRGFHSYVLAKPEVSRDEYINDYYYEYTYLFVFGEYSFDMDGDGYKMPNSWVVDAVGLSVAAEWQWNVVSPTLDSGWAHCGSVDRDANRYGKSVIRLKNGSKWVDTNNSTADFLSDAPASMLSSTSGIADVRSNDTVADNAIYTISGMRVSKADKPGLYIIGGRKVVVK